MRRHFVVAALRVTYAEYYNVPLVALNVFDIFDKQSYVLSVFLPAYRLDIVGAELGVCGALLFDDVFYARLLLSSESYYAHRVA